MRYIVNDMTAYGIYNGFSESNDAFQSLLKDELSAIYENDFCDFLNLSKKIIEALRDDKDTKQAAMAYYTPYPILDWWSDEYKNARLKQIAERSAPGYCDIPDELVPDLIRPVLNKCLAEYVREKTMDCKALIKRAEGQRKIPTVEEARKWQTAYNNVHNEGGEGYVPYVVTDTEYENAKSTLAFLEDMVTNKPSLSEQIQSAASRAEGPRSTDKSPVRESSRER